MARVRVDLDHPRISADMARRYDLLATIAEELFEGGGISRAEIYLDEDELLRTVQAYFLLSEAYKLDKLGHREDSEHHWTEATKKAALTTLAVMQFRPLRPLAPARTVLDNWTIVANQVLSLSTAASLLEREFPELGWETQRRLFKVLDRIGRKPWGRIRSLDAYIRDQRSRRFHRVYEIDIDADLWLIDSLILLYESLLRPRR